MKGRERKVSFKKCIAKIAVSLALGVMVVSNVGKVDAYAWHGKDHQAALDYGNPGVSASDLDIMKKTQIEVDKKEEEGGFFRCENPVFHGGGDFVSTYIYLMTIAKKCRDNKNFGLYELDTQVYHPAGDGNKTFNLVVSKTRALFANDSKELKKILKRNKITDNARNRGAFFAGLAMHCGMDAYAHSAYGFVGDGKYKHIEGNKNCQDDIAYYPNRYDCAKEFTKKAMKIWKNNSYPKADAFYLLGVHNIGKNGAKNINDKKMGFKLRNFRTNLTRNNVSADFYEWATQRSATDEPIIWGETNYNPVFY